MTSPESPTPNKDSSLTNNSLSPRGWEALQDVLFPQPRSTTRTRVIGNSVLAAANAQLGRNPEQSNSKHPKRSGHEQRKRFEDLTDEDFEIDESRVIDPEIRRSFEQTIKLTHEMSHTFLPELQVPTVEDLDEANLNWEKLENAKRAYDAIGQKSEGVLFPVNLPPEQQQAFWSGLRAWQETNDSNAKYKLQQRTDGDGLYMQNNTEAMAIYSAIDPSVFPGTKVEMPGLTMSNPNQLNPNQPNSSIIWQYILMPTGNRTELGTGSTSFDLTTQGEGYKTLMQNLKDNGLNTMATNPNDNPPVGAGLMATAMSIYRKQEPLNSNGGDYDYHWSYESDQAAGRALCVYFDPDGGQAGVYWGGVGWAGSRGLRRPSEWG